MEYRAQFDWRAAPFARILLALLGGMAVAAALPWQLPQPALWILGSWLMFVLLHQYRKRRRRFPQFLRGFFFLLPFFFLGWAAPEWRSPLRSAHHIYRIHDLAQPNDSLWVRVLEPPEKRNKSWRMLAEAVQLGKNRSCGKLLLYFAPDPRLPALHAGDLLCMRYRLRPPSPPQHPGAFDYALWLKREHIYLQAWLQTHDWVVAGKDRQNRLGDYAMRIRSWSLETLHRYLGRGDASGLAAALLFGYRGELSPELMQVYANTGAVHVLAVSGMHTAILFVALQFLLKPLLRLRHLRWLVPLLILAGLWGYALLAGLPPSVNRAAFMCSLLLLATQINRRSQIYNTLAATAFFLLLYEPNWLYSAGFQLSFFAVLGIVWLQAPVRRWWVARNRVVDYFWQLTAVSMAAQLLTLPLGLYYFHQFPTYFWLSNWLVIPLASVLMAGSFLVLLLSPFPGLAQAIGEVTRWLMELQNTIIRQIDALPGAVWDGWSLSFPMLLLLYASLVAGLVALLMHLKKAWWLAIGSALLLCVLALVQQLQWQQQFTFTVYATKKQSTWSIIRGRNAWLRGIDDPATKRFVWQGHAVQAGIQREIAVNATKTPCLLELAGKKILLLSGKSSRQLPDSLPAADLIVSSNNLPWLRMKYQQQLRGKLLLLDATNSAYYCKSTQAQLRKAGIAVRSVADEGSITLSLCNTTTSNVTLPNASATSP